MTALTLYLGESTTRNIVVNNFMLAAQRENMKICFIKRESESYLEKNQLPENAEVITAQKDSIERFFDTMIEEMQNRHPILENYCDNNGISLKKPNYRGLVFDYMYENCRPWMIFIEGFADMCGALEFETDLQKKIVQLFTAAPLYQMYVIAGINPDEEEKFRESLLYLYFNPQKMIMFFGKDLSTQTLMNIPQSTINECHMELRNRAIMLYQNDLYPLMVPVGDIKTDDEDEDLKPIFG
jgi:hypothetical protein